MCIVIDAGGVASRHLGRTGHQLGHPEAAWPAWSSSGGARDTGDIRALGFPLFCSLVTPTAGEPKGFGEIGIPIRITGVRVSPGDWIIGDDDGVCVIPRDKAVEYTNRAMDVLERRTGSARRSRQAARSARSGISRSGRNGRRDLVDRVATRDDVVLRLDCSPLQAEPAPVRRSADFQRSRTTCGRACRPAAASRPGRRDR